MTSEEFKGRNLAVGDVISLRLLSASNAAEEFLINGGTVRIVSINYSIWFFWKVISVEVMLTRLSGYGTFKINLSKILEII